MSETLQEQFVESDGYKFKRWFPWLNLFRAFRLSVGLRVLLLSVAASLMLAVGEYAISWMPFSPHMDDDTEASEGNDPEPDPRPDLPRTTWPWEPGFLGAGEFGSRSFLGGDGNILPGSRATIQNMSREPWGVFFDSLGYGAYILWPVRTVIEPAAVLFSKDATWSAAAVAWCELVWALFVWSVVAVAIVRIVALEFAGRESPSLAGSIKFSLLQLPAAIGSVILPSVALAGLYFVCRIAGWIALAEWMQPVVGLFWIFGLLCGLGMAVILMLLAAGWPLMLCTMGIDRGDSFEGFTRAFSYIFGRPWYSLWLLLLATLYGSLVFVFVVAVAASSASLAETAAGAHSGIQEITALKPELLGEPDYSRGREIDPITFDVSEVGEGPIEAETDADREEPEGKLARSAGGFWLRLWATLCVAFAGSFFWTSSSLIYLLLRKSVDATPLDEIHDGDAQTQTQGLPLSGIAAAEQREQQLNTGGPGNGGNAEA